MSAYGQAEGQRSTVRASLTPTRYMEWRAIFVRKGLLSAKRMRQFFKELKRRKVVRVAAVYAIVAWLLVEVASVVFPGLLLPDWSTRLVIVMAIIGFPIALVLAWAIDVTPDGIKFDAGPPENLADEVPANSHDRDLHDTRTSIAVLPLLNLSADPENEYFSDGMAEEVLTLLCKLPQLKVASRTSSFSFRGKDVDLSTVAEKLGVDVILEGSVRRSGDRVRTTAQLIDAHSDRHLWSETYDRELKDVFAVQDEIAHSIVDALEITLSSAQERSIKKRAMTDDMDAYDCYLRGRYYFERGDVKFALQMFEKAIERDPEFALGWAGVADCRAWMCMWQEKTSENLQSADECSLKALRLAPELAGTHASRGFALSLNARHAEAEKEFEAAISLDPQLFEAYYFAGRAFFAQGKFREAAEMFAKAEEIRPEDVSAATLRVTALKSLGAHEEAREAAKHAAEIVENHLTLNPDDSIALSRGANVLVQAGETDRGLEWAERALAINPDNCGYNVACTFASAGKLERALDILEEFLQANFLYIDWLENDSDWDAARDHPRFKKILGSLS